MPPFASIAEVNSWSWRRIAWYIDARLWIHNGVDSTTSVIKKVTMPSGSDEASSALNAVPGEVVVVPSVAARGTSVPSTTRKSSIVCTRRKKCALYEGRKLHSAKSVANSPSRQTSGVTATNRPSLVTASESTPRDAAIDELSTGSSSWSAATATWISWRKLSRSGCGSANRCSCSIDSLKSEPSLPEPLEPLAPCESAGGANPASTFSKESETANSRVARRYTSPTGAHIPVATK